MAHLNFEDIYQVPDLKFDVNKMRADLDTILKKKGFKSIKISDFLNERSYSDYIINTKPDFLEEKVIRINKHLKKKVYVDDENNVYEYLEDSSIGDIIGELKEGIFIKT